MKGKGGFYLFLGVMIMFIPLTSDAYRFRPSEIEWQAWPGHCRARYATTDFGSTTKFARRVSAADNADLAEWQSAGIYGIHHYCTGIIWLRKAKLEQDEVIRGRYLKQARSETAFTYDRSQRSSPLFSYVAVQMASVHFEMEEFELAFDILTESIAANPKGSVLYSALAVMQRRLGRLEDAMQTLLRGDEATEGSSAEIAYNLGLISLELGNVDDAEEYADRAYALGFPLTGLRTKLKRLGRY